MKQFTAYQAQLLIANQLKREGYSDEEVEEYMDTECSYFCPICNNAGVIPTHPQETYQWLCMGCGHEF